MIGAKVVYIRVISSVYKCIHIIVYVVMAKIGAKIGLQHYFYSCLVCSAKNNGTNGLFCGLF